MRAVVLVDGEHYPAVTRWGIDAASREGHDAVAALMIGGTEKIGSGGAMDSAFRSDEARTIRSAALASPRSTSFAPGGRARHVRRARPRIPRAHGAGVGGLARGLPVSRRDFRLDPPIADHAAGRADGGRHRYRQAHRQDRVVARSPADRRHGARSGDRRDGPWGATRTPGGQSRDGLPGLPARPRARGAITRPRITWRTRSRPGSPRSGRVERGRSRGPARTSTNVREAAELAAGYGSGVVVLEGSGAAVPPGALGRGHPRRARGLPEEYLGGYLGPLPAVALGPRGCYHGRQPEPGSENLFLPSGPTSGDSAGDARPIVTDFNPEPLADVRGKDAFFTTTAPGEVAARQVDHLEQTTGAASWDGARGWRTGRGWPRSWTAPPSTTCSSRS